MLYRKPIFPRRWLPWIFGAGLLAYSLLVEPFWIQVNTYPMASNGNSLIRVVQLSDLHLRGIGIREKKVLDQLHGLHPDLIIFSGDIVDRPGSMESLEQFLAMTPDSNKFAVMGNWEYWGSIDRERLAAIYKKHSVSLLINARSDIQVRGQKIGVVGLDDFTAGSPKIDGLISSGDIGPLLLIEHSPGFFEEKGEARQSQKNSGMLCLSGHTHGGQVSFFGIPLWTPPGSGSFTAGWYETNRCKLYVSRGIGTSSLPIRFWTRPEIAVFDIR
jgi:predicted MPP superfamily phosphohydrolase